MTAEASLFLFRSAFLRPSERFVASPLPFLQRFRPTILTYRYIDDAPATLAPWATCPDPPPRGALRRAFGNLPAEWYRRVASAQRPLVHAHFGEDGAEMLPLATRLRMPLVVTFYGHDVSRLPTPYTVRPAWLRYWLRHRSLIRGTAVAIAYARHIERRLVALGWPPDRVLTLYTGTEVPSAVAYDPVPGRLFALGRLVPKKGFLTLLRAMSMVKSPVAHLRIAGSGPLRDVLVRAVADWGLQKRVTLVPWLDPEAVQRELAEAALFLAPSETAPDGDMEGLPTVLVEAAALGRPLLGTAHAGIPEIVRNGVNGTVVPERDPPALACAIDAILARPDMAARYARASWQLARTEFDIERQSERLASLYDSVLDGRLSVQPATNGGAT